MSNFAEKVYKIVSKIPKGGTLTYKEVSRLAGSPKAYRVVGNLMARNRDFVNIPCHRVISSTGSVGGYSGIGGVKKKIELLTSEGVKVIDGIVFE